MTSLDITPLILTYNEAPNLRRTLEQLPWAQDIVVLDSFSTDGTLEIARAFPQVRVVQRTFDTHTLQWNFGLEQCRSEWVLALDADYVLSAELVDELQALQPPPEVKGYSAGFVYCMMGHPLRGTLYPPRLMLFRKSSARYEQDGHTQQVNVAGPTAWLQGRVHHDDRKPLARWLWAQDKYAALEVRKLLTAPPGSLRAQDRLRLWMLPAPFVVLLYTLFWKRAFLDGWPGWLYAFQRLTAELILSLHLLEARLHPKVKGAVLHID